MGGEIIAADTPVQAAKFSVERESTDRMDE
jgi:hypothetical protein